MTVAAEVTTKRYTKDELFKSSMRALTNLAATLLIDFDPKLSPPDLKTFLVGEIMAKQADAALNTPLDVNSAGYLAAQDEIAASLAKEAMQGDPVVETAMQNLREDADRADATARRGAGAIPDHIFNELTERLGIQGIRDRVKGLETDSSNRIKTLEKAVADLQSAGRQAKALHGSIDDLGKVEHLQHKA